jgi:hypothetical protein
MKPCTQVTFDWSACPWGVPNGAPIYVQAPVLLGANSRFGRLVTCRENSVQQTWSRLRNRDRKPSRFDSRSSRFRFEPIRVETSKSRIVIDFFNFDFGIYICMFSEKSVLFRYYRNVTDSYRKYVMTIKITVLLPIFVPPSLFHRFDTDVYNK